VNAAYALQFAPDHIQGPVPGSRRAAVRSGCNSYRNLVSSCIECNSQKGEKPADDFLRRLYREGHLNASELAGRLRALDDLATGKLRPAVPENGK
jgi:hypothetical protein